MAPRLEATAPGAPQQHYYGKIQRLGSGFSVGIEYHLTQSSKLKGVTRALTRVMCMTCQEYLYYLLPYWTYQVFKDQDTWESTSVLTYVALCHMQAIFGSSPNGIH